MIEDKLNTLLNHKNHWEHLMSENICDINEGQATIEALDFAIASITALSSLKTKIDDYLLLRGISAENRKIIREIVDKQVNEVLHDQRTS